MSKTLTRGAAKAAVVRKASKRNNSIQAKADADAEWAIAVFDAAEADIPYQEIADDSGVSKTRVDQVLQSERRRRGIPHTNTNKISKASLARAAKKAAKRVPSKGKK